MKLVITSFLLISSAFANYSIRKDKVAGVIITDTVAPSKECKKLGELYVSIHQKGSNQENLAKAAAEADGDFVFLRSKSPYYSYEYGGELYKCN